MKLLRELSGDRVNSRPLWPLRSPDLTPLPSDFYLWDNVKDKFFQELPKFYCGPKGTDHRNNKRNYTGGTEESVR